MGRTLVTGAAGFIGSAVVRRLLARGREVRCFVEPGLARKNLEGLDVEIMEGDVTDFAACRRAARGCDRVFHLAAVYAIWHPRPQRMYEVNVGGTQNVLRAAGEAGASRVVHTSSIAAVGYPRDGRPADETLPFDQWEEATDYERSKWLSEQDALRFAQAGLPVVVVNPGFPFGARDVGPTPTGQALLDLLAGRIFGYPPGGLGVIDVEDLAEGHLLAEEKGRVGERYLLVNHNVTYADFYAAAARVAKVATPRRRIPPWLLNLAGRWYEHRARRTGERPLLTVKSARFTCERMYYDNTKARTELGLPCTSLEESLRRAVEWFRQNGYT